MAEYDDRPYVVVERRSGGLGAFFMGTALGVGIALLLAPRSGRETRQEIQESVERLKRNAENTLKQVQDTVADTIQDARREMDDRIGQARDAMQAGREAARETRDQLEHRIRTEPEDFEPPGEEGPSGTAPQGDGESH